MGEIDADGDLLGAVRSYSAVELGELASVNPRWVLDEAAREYRALLAAGVRLNRCHDIATTERVLLARSGQHDEPVHAAAIAARAAGLPAPQQPAEPDGQQEGLFATSTKAATDPVMLANALNNQRARLHDPAVRLLAAAESACALLAVEMTAYGLPWDAVEHDRLLTSVLGPKPLPTLRPVRLQELATQIDVAFGGPVNPDSAAEIRRAVQRNGWAWFEQWVRDGRF